MTTLVHDDLIAVVRNFTVHELLTRAETPGLLPDVWQRLVALDLDRALLAGDLGGVGLDVEDFLCVLEEVAVGDAGIALAVLLNNAALVTLPAETAAALPAGVRWTLALAPGVDEPAGDRVGLAHETGLARVSGRLAGVFAAVGADGVVVATRVPEPTVFAVPVGTPGLTVLPDPTQMGLQAARSADLIFADVALPAAPVLDADALESRARSLVRCGVAAISRGIARRAREIALVYARNRIQGGVPIIRHGAVGDMLAEMTVRLRICAVVHQGGLDDPAAALAHKIAASDAAMASTLDAVQVLGGIGYLSDTGVEKLMRDAKYCQLYPERNWLARAELMHLDRRFQFPDGAVRRG